MNSQDKRLRSKDKLKRLQDLRRNNMQQKKQQGKQLKNKRKQKRLKDRLKLRLRQNKQE
jgi:hypothetical protein